jgi:DeoR family fructose operon transcriptional repressor
MYAAERHQQILAVARADGRVEVNSLAEALDVTPETVRRDLTALERQGMLRRVHGGAIPLAKLGFEPRLDERRARFTSEKERIAKAAVDELPAEGTILLDAGSTTQLLAEHLPTDRELTIVTNSIDIASVVSRRENLSLYLIGGRVRGRTLAAVGQWATEALASVNVDVAFLGTNGITVRHGLTTPDQEEALVKRAMVASARRVIALCDTSKFGTDHFAQVAALSEIDTVITNADLDEDTVAEIEAAGTNVVLT